MDIFIVVERRGPDSAWRIVERPGPASSHGPPEWEVWRNYICFSMMAGKELRVGEIDPHTAIAPERGLPADLSKAAKHSLDQQLGLMPGQTSRLDEAVAVSWLDLNDLDEFDWDAPLTWNYNALPPRGVAEITEDMRLYVLDHVQLHLHPPRGWRIAGGPPPRLAVAAPATPRYFGKQLLEIVGDMRAVNVGGLGDVRCVFVVDY